MYDLSSNVNFLRITRLRKIMHFLERKKICWVCVEPIFIIFSINIAETLLKNNNFT